MFKKGVYAATISIINKDYSLNIDETVKHAERLINNGLHGVLGQPVKASFYQVMKKKL